MWLTCSSIGRKLVMSITGACLVLFVTFHAVMNAVALFNPAAYNDVCEFLGANWYALIASMGLAVLFIIHIIYAIWLTVQNRKARGNDRYNVFSKPPQVEWASQNMLVLGIVVLAFLFVHLIQFWAKMQFQELIHADLTALPQIEGAPAAPALGTLFLQLAFSQIWTPIVYIIGFVALWFHMNHGFWSMFQSCGWDNDIWINRLKKIGMWWTSIVVVLFIAQAITFTVMAQNKSFLTCPELQQQYAETWNEEAVKVQEDFTAGLTKVMAPLQKQAKELQATGNQAGMMEIQSKYQEAQQQYISEVAPSVIARGEAIVNGFEKLCPEAVPGMELQQLMQMIPALKQMAAQSNPAMAPAAEDVEVEAAAVEPTDNTTDSVKK